MRAPFALLLASCTPAVLATPSSSDNAARLSRMAAFEAWWEGFRASLSSPSSREAARAASSAIGVLRDRTLWASPAMAPSLIPRDRLVQLARWQSLRAVETRPEDPDAVETLAVLDAIAGDRLGEARCRCDLAELYAESFERALDCAEALAAAGEERLARAGWDRAYARARDDGERFQLFLDVTQAFPEDSLSRYPPDAVARWRDASELRGGR